MGPDVKKCLTTQLLLAKVSGCLVEKPECAYAHKFGFSYVCRHPDHAEYHAHIAGTLTKDDALAQYDTMRRKRRDEFTASLDETSRVYFCRQTDFFGLPLANMDMNISTSTPPDQP